MWWLLLAILAFTRRPRSPPDPPPFAFVVQRRMVPFGDCRLRERLVLVPTLTGSW